MTTTKKLPTKNLSGLPLSMAIASALMVLAPLAQAQSLVELYESARSFDTTYQSAKLQYDANLARADQARAGILPSAGLAAGVSRIATAVPARQLGHLRTRPQACGPR